MLLRTTCLSVLLLLCLVEETEERQAISARTWEKLKGINTTEFLMKFVKKKSYTRLPTTDSERKAEQVNNILFTHSASVPNQQSATQVSGMIAVNDACEPKLVPVKIPQTDPSILLWPTCTKLNRCSGCCGSSIYECTPVKKVVHTLSVLQCQPTLPGSDDFNVVGMQNMNFDEHLACECQCKTKEHHCDRNKHTYLPHECRCRCRNEAEAVNCRSPKKWDDDTCGCVCREVYNCHPDEVFSHTNCRCEIRSSRSQSSSGTESGPCAAIKCSEGFVKQPYMGRCRCVAGSASISVQQGSNPGGGSTGYRRRPSTYGRRYPG